MALQVKISIGTYVGRQIHTWFATVDCVLELQCKGCQHLHLAIRQILQSNQRDIENYLQHGIEKGAIIRKIFKFVHQNAERLVYFQGAFGRIRESWQPCNAFLACEASAEIRRKPMKRRVVAVSAEFRGKQSHENGSR